MATTTPSAVTVPVNDNLDAVSSPGLERRLNGLVEEGSTRLVLDLTNLRYLASAGLRTIIAAHRFAGMAGGGLHLAGLNGFAQTVVEQSGIAGRIPTFATVEEAAAAF